MNYTKILVEKMNYTFVPSLEHLALVKIATALWNQSDIRALIIKFFEDVDTFPVWNCHKVQEKVKEKVLLLPEPRPLKEKILGVIKPIGLEIYRWMNCNSVSYNLAVNLPSEFSWTPQGILDRKKTAETLIRDETIDITERYKLACIYCLKNYVRALWEKIPENYKASFYNEEHSRRVGQQHELVIFWTYYIKGEMAKLDNILSWHTYNYRWRIETCTPEQYPFKCAVIHSNKVAAEYFWDKLSSEEREDSLTFVIDSWEVDHFHTKGYSDWFDMLHFLFPRMNRDQQAALFQKYGWQVLLCFLQWPSQSLFLEMTDHVVLTNTEYYLLLDRIVRKITDGYKDYDYQMLFGEFWQKSTTSYKKSIIDKFCAGDILLQHLFHNKDVKNILLILKDASVVEKENIGNNMGSSLFVSLFHAKKLDMLNFFINEFISSREKMIKLKGECLEEISWHDDHLQKFLDDLIQNFNLKRSTEKSHCSPGKRLCSSSNM